jgi:TonB family protein
MTLLAALCCVLATAQGETPVPGPSGEPTPVPIATDTFSDARPKNVPFAPYPWSEISSGEEGWVVVSMMVDSTGKPFEAAVLRSTGNKVFERVALQTVEHGSFEPATVNGTPVDSAVELTYEVRTQPSRGVQPQFVRAFRSFQAALKAHDRAAADAAMQQLVIKSLYENAYYGMVQYEYAYQWGNGTGQEAALARALGGEQYLAPSERRAMLLANLGVQLQKQDYYEALQMWDRLRKLGGLDKDPAAKFQQVIADVEQLRTDSRAYTMSGTIEERGAWSVHLLKRRFQAAAVSGALSAVKLRCKRGFVSFALDPDLDYNVPKSLGECALSLEGTPGTVLTLTQS